VRCFQEHGYCVLRDVLGRREACCTNFSTPASTAACGAAAMSLPAGGVASRASWRSCWLRRTSWTGVHGCPPWCRLSMRSLCDTLVVLGCHRVGGEGAAKRGQGAAHLVPQRAREAAAAGPPLRAGDAGQGVVRARADRARRLPVDAALLLGPLSPRSHTTPGGAWGAARRPPAQPIPRDGPIIPPYTMLHLVTWLLQVCLALEPHNCTTCTVFE
jgi:hypothetical protein